MAISPNVWWFAFLYLAASVGTGVNNTVHNSYLADAYPTEGRGRIFSWHNLSDPLSQTIGILIFGFVVTIAHDWRYGLLVALAGIPLGFALFTLREPEKGANESSHILKASGMDLQSQQEKAPRVLLGSAVTRLLRVRSLYYELVAVAILGFAGTGAPLFGNLFFIDKFHLDTAVAQRGLRHHRPGRLPRASRWPTCSATATSAARPSGRSSSPASASRPTAGSSSSPSTCPSSGCA